MRRRFIWRSSWRWRASSVFVTWREFARSPGGNSVALLLARLHVTDAAITDARLVAAEHGIHFIARTSAEGTVAVRCVGIRQGFAFETGWCVGRGHDNSCNASAAYPRPAAAGYPVVADQ